MQTRQLQVGKPLGKGKALHRSNGYHYPGINHGFTKARQLNLVFVG